MLCGYMVHHCLRESDAVVLCSFCDKLFSLSACCDTIRTVYMLCIAERETHRFTDDDVYAIVCVCFPSPST
jgi:hypothetical protein